MEIQEYIRNARISSRTDEQIINSLAANGWTVEQIQPYLGNNDSQIIVASTIDTPKKSKWKFIFLGLFILLLLGLGITYSYLNSSNVQTIKDTKNGFEFTNLEGWQKVSPVEGAYLSLATVRDQKYIFSYADVRIIPNNMPDKFIDRMLTEDKTKEMTDLCKTTAIEQKMTYLGIEKLSIPRTNSYKCISEGVGENTKGNILVIENYIITKPKSNIIVSTSYQKNLPEEAENVKRLMNGFRINY